MVPAAIAVIAVVGYFNLLVPGKLAEQSTSQTLIGPTWQLTSYNYLVFDGQNGDHRSEDIAVAHPERYSLTFNAGGTAVLTADCDRSIWHYTIDYGQDIRAALQGRPRLLFSWESDPGMVPGCESTDDVALDVTGGLARDSFGIYLEKTRGIEFRPGALVLLRPLETNPFTGRYADTRPLEQVFIATSGH
jgi:hypothetical protein